MERTHGFLSSVSEGQKPIGGNTIRVKTLDLNKPFALIADQLNKLTSGL